MGRTRFHLSSELVIIRLAISAATRRETSMSVAHGDEVGATRFGEPPNPGTEQQSKVEAMLSRARANGGMMK